MDYSSMTDPDLVSLCLWREARNQSSAGRLGVLSVIRNRVGPRFRKTLREIVLQPGQFSSFDKGNSQAVLFPTAAHAADWKAWLDIRTLVANNPPDNTAGANFYHDKSVPPPARAWLGKGATVEQLVAKRTVIIGDLRFYKL